MNGYFLERTRYVEWAVPVVSNEQMDKNEPEKKAINELTEKAKDEVIGIWKKWNGKKKKNDICIYEKAVRSV